MTNERTFICESCGVSFESDRTDETAAAEMKAIFGRTPDEIGNDVAVVCSECFERIMTTWNTRN